MRLEYWDFVRRETLDRIFPEGFPGTELEHASLIETSLMLLLRPDLVAQDKIPQEGRASFPPYDIFPAPTGYLRGTGVLADARGCARGNRPVADGRPVSTDHRGGEEGIRPVTVGSITRDLEDAAALPLAQARTLQRCRPIPTRIILHKRKAMC